jgi:hypothetical protein
VDLEEVARVDVALGGGGERVADELDGALARDRRPVGVELVLQPDLRGARASAARGAAPRAQRAWLSRSGWISSCAVPSARYDSRWYEPTTSKW